MRLVLIYPPFGDPRAPQLALPSLAAFARGQGIAVEMIDANVLAFEDLARPATLATMQAALAARLSRDASPKVWRAAVLAESLMAAAPGALAALRGVDFYDAGTLAAARLALSDLLFCAGVAWGGIDCALTPIRYEVEGLNPEKLNDLLKIGRDHDLFWGAGTGILDAIFPRDLVGITLTNYQQIVPGLSLARRLKAAGACVVLGGALITKFVDTLPQRRAFFDTFCDAVIGYEGETALVALARAQANGDDLSTVPNIVAVQGDRIITGPVRVEDVACLPTPDFSGLPLDRYLTPEPVLPILTGKGCYFNRCKFCDIPFINHVSKKAYRVRPAATIVDDVHRLYERHGATAFSITDEALSPRLLLQLADAFEARPGPFAFTGYARLEPGFDEATCKRIAGFGMKKIYFGLESASQAMIDHMDKGVNIARAPAVLAACRAAGIDFHLFSMFGLPEEQEHQMRETLAFLLDNANAIDAPGVSFDLHPFGLEMRTPYFDRREAFGIALKPDALDGDFIIGFSGDQWENTRGVSAAGAARLVEEDFLPALKARFQRWHAAPDPVWPMQGEYAVLYARAHAAKEFVWRSALPETDETAFAFQFLPHALMAMQPGVVRVTTALHSLDLPEDIVALARDETPRVWKAHLHANARERAPGEARGYIEAMIALGLVLIKLTPTAAMSPGVERHSQTQEAFA